MKIAIRGHESRGKEVIQIFKDLGTEGLTDHTGSHIDWVYFRDDSLRPNQLIVGTDIAFLKGYGYKVYTLEEFEKEFPFKIGDRVISLVSGLIGTITEFSENGTYHFKYDNGICSVLSASYLKLYKEMKEERNITLTLDKAKEWYKKGGELREIALQAFTEKELIVLPKSWEEFCEKHPVKHGECWLGSQDKISMCAVSYEGEVRKFKNWIPSKESAEAHLAMIQLEQLRNCWWGDWKPEWSNSEKYVIRWDGDNLIAFTARRVHAFLVFPTIEMAGEFLECFRDLIEKAGDLI